MIFAEKPVSTLGSSPRAGFFRITLKNSLPQFRISTLYQAGDVGHRPRLAIVPVAAALYQAGP
jgi:hypothetical protein